VSIVTGYGKNHRHSIPDRAGIFTFSAVRQTLAIMQLLVKWNPASFSAALKCWCVKITDLLRLVLGLRILLAVPPFLHTFSWRGV
jgi:hypothetical protein